MTIAKTVNSWNETYDYNDHLGTPIMEAATEFVSSASRYTPYGEVWASTSGDDVGFTGHIKDDASGLTYMQARYYDPVIGRFLSNDPVGFAEGGAGYFNRYWYTAGDPVNFRYPDGRAITSSSTVENEDGTTTPAVNINFTGARRNTSSSRIGSPRLGRLANRAAKQIEDSFSESNTDASGNAEIYNTDTGINIGGATSKNGRHNIEIVDKYSSSLGQGFVQIAGFEPRVNAGRSPICGNDIFLNQKLISNRSEFKRTAAHEFGHSAGLCRPNQCGNRGRIPVNNLMIQSRFSSLTAIIPSQLEKIVGRTGN
ncbi:MAG: RHS repeat-associated core domain-containing protein [Pseudomonadota bacterium]